MLYIDTRLSLADDLLLFGDKMTMANSLEMRVPFLDIDLVNFLESLPATFKLRNGVHKFLHKKSLSRWLPQEIINRPKRGFATPMDLWLQGELVSYVRKLFDQPDSSVREYFNHDELHRMIDAHSAKRENYQRHLFALLSFELWHRAIIRNEPCLSELKLF